MSRLDKSLLLAIFALIGIGLVQVYSSSFIFAFETRGDGLFFFKRQLSFAIFAIPILFGVALMPFRWIEKYGWLLWAAATLGIAITFIPGLGIKAGGSARWLNLPGGFVFEPSELLKLSVGAIFGTFLVQRKDFFGQAEWPARLAIIVVPLVLVLLQRDFGSFFICSAVFFCLIFAFGLKWRYIVAGLSVALPTFYFLVMSTPYRRARVMAFLDPWADAEGKGFQLIQSMLSFQSGGLFGEGLGQGQGKLFFLPEAHTDFTLAVLGEEMGFIGFAIVILIYGFVVLRGLQIAARAENTYAKALALGLSMAFAFQIFINVGVNLGLLPPKGLTLPFLSYGGSSLLVSCILMGLLLNVERFERSSAPVGEKAARLFRSAGRRPVQLRRTTRR